MKEDTPTTRIVRALNGKCINCGYAIEFADPADPAKGFRGGQPAYGRDQAILGAIIRCDNCGIGLGFNASGHPMQIRRRASDLG